MLWSYHTLLSYETKRKWCLKRLIQKNETLIRSSCIFYWTIFFQLEGTTMIWIIPWGSSICHFAEIIWEPAWVSYQNACADCRRIKVQMLELRNQTHASTGKLAEPINFYKDHFLFSPAKKLGISPPQTWLVCITHAHCPCLLIHSSFLRSRIWSFVYELSKQHCKI